MNVEKGKHGAFFVTVTVLYALPTYLPNGKVTANHLRHLTCKLKTQIIIYKRKPHVCSKILKVRNWWYSALPQYEECTAPVILLFVIRWPWTQLYISKPRGQFLQDKQLLNMAWHTKFLLTLSWANFVNLVDTYTCPCHRVKANRCI